MNRTALTLAAGKVDQLSLVLTLVCAIVVFIVTAVMIYFIWRYHAGKKATRSSNVQSTGLEVTWTIGTLAVFMAFFSWGSSVYKSQVKPVSPDYEIFVFGKRWMWKFHHPSGLVEVNHLHLPAKKNVRLTMISEDVIHSFYIPELRTKQDLLPGTLTAIPIRSVREGTFPLYCAEYCGTFHSRMGGKVTFLEESAYRKYTGVEKKNLTLPERGKKLFSERGCISCHSDPRLAPNLAGLTDDTYIRESILYPEKVVRFRFEAVMPAFKDALTESEIRDLTEYIKELR